MLWMGKYLVFCFVFATMGISASPQSKPSGPPTDLVTKQDRTAGSSGTADTKKDENASPNVTVIVKQENAPSHQSEEKRDDDNVRIQRRLANLTAWLVAVGFVQAVILAGTILVIYQQVRTARSVERAWVIASPEINAPPLGFIPEGGDPISSDHRNIFICGLKSTGNTPARLVNAASQS
jgi:hypothetical protein